MQKYPANDITLELAPGSPLSELQCELYRDIERVYEKYRGKTSLRVYILGYEEPPNIPRRKRKKSA